MRADVSTITGYDQAKPASQNYTAAMRYSIGGAIGHANSFGGLYLMDATNGDLYAFYYLFGNNSGRVCDLEVSKWGNSGSFFGGSFTALKGLTNTPIPTNLRIVYTNSSTAIDFEASFDGGNSWVNIWSESSDAIGHGRVGFFKTKNGGGNEEILNIDWFRRTA
jgi:hypothetical protein